jgi:hypothetical protein
MRILQCVAVAGLAVATWTGTARAQSSCLTNADTASRFIRGVTQHVTLGDSAATVANGLPYNPPAGVTLVTDPPTCAAVVTALNDALGIPAGSPDRKTRAYVLRVGTTAFAAVDEGTATLKMPVYAFFSASYASLEFVAEIQ